jgi:transcriptional regulator with XRE-family HTH domain
MKLDKWIEKTGVRPSDLADELRVSRMALWRYRQGERIPSPEIMRRLMRRTQGEVQPNDFYPAR